METILITGGAGFIGSHLAEALAQQGRAVVIVDNLNSYYSRAAKERNLQELRKNKNVHIENLDILRLEEMDRLFTTHKISRVVHLAARAGVRPSVENPQQYADDNIIGTINLLELSRKHQVKNFVFASSSSVYGINAKVPFSESDAIDRIISPYGITKRAGELYCSCYHHLYGLPITCLRFFTVYGPRGRPDMMIYAFTKAIEEGTAITVYGDGSTSRDYTYVADIVDGILAALDKDLGFEIINLGNASPVMLRDIIDRLEQLLGKKAVRQPLPMPIGDVPRTCADISKAQRLLGYNPKIKIEEGLALFVEWYHHNI